MSNNTIGWDEIAAMTEEVSAPEGGHGPVAEGVNQKVIADFRANQGRLSGEVGGAGDFMLLTVTGAKSGKERIAPLAYFDIDGRIIIIASMGGSPRNPNWFTNILAKPEVTVEIGAEKYTANAVITQGADRDALFATVCERMPVFAGYQEKTERKIPVVELVRA